MTRRNPERPPGPSYYRLPEASWTMIRDEYLSGWTAKEIGAKWRVSPTSVYRHASDGGWNKYARGQAFHDQIVAEAAAGEGEAWPREEWTSLKDPPPPSMRRWPHNLPGMGPMRRPQWEPPAGYGPMPPELVPPVQRPPEPPEDEADAPSAAEAAEQAVAAAARAVAAGRYEEAERLGRLAVTLRKLAGAGPVGAGGATGGDRVQSVENEDAEQTLEPGDRPLNCTAKTCAMTRVTEVLEARLDALFGDMQGPDAEDLEDWTDMAVGIGARGDPDVMRLGEVYRAKGMDDIRREIIDLCGSSPSGDRLPNFNAYRTR
jgi:hypothetical protein